ncbi:O-antigen ligase domain-containing protein, partial [Alteromonas sp. BZK5]|nr:O-antigen ligase domain-containing protein [Alteromonas sp. BZK5]
MLQILLFATTHIACVVMSIARAPVYAFVLYQAIYFIHPANRWWGYMVPNLPYSFMSVAFMFLMVAINFRSAKTNKFYKVPTFKWQFMLLIITWFTYTQAIAPWHHTQLLDAYTKMFIILILAFLLISNAKHLR